MKKVLITGGAGFIGSHLAELLLAEGAGVTVIDDLSTGSKANIEHLLANEHFKFVEGKVEDARVVDRVVEDSDYVYHLAAAVGVKLIVDQPIKTIKTNIYGTETILEAVSKYGKKLLIASTSEVYGKSEAVPFSEDDDVVYGSTKFSRWSYACSKAVDEFLALAFYKQYGLKVVITRFFNTVGPRQSGLYGMVVPRFIRAALRSEPLTIYGDGRQTRCFCYVGDVVKAAKQLIENDGSFGEIYNLGSSEEVSIEQLADKIIELTSSQSEKKFIPYTQAYGQPFDDMKRRVPSLDKAAAAVGYEPQYCLNETLKAIIDYEKKVYAKQDARG